MLFDAYESRSLRLKNRAVMAPMTRSRAVDKNTPNEMMAEYYGQRASAGLIITEGTAPSPNGLGYARIPGMFNGDQVKGWRLITTAVHNKGGKIFVQLMHTGRITHEANLPDGARVLSPTAEICPGQMFTDKFGMQPHSQPRAMTEKDIADTVAEYGKAAGLAIEAGFDGIELHGANGYLLEQFLNANVNKRTDGYGGSNEGRNRFALEVARAAATAIGADKVAIRLSPYGAAGGTGAFAEVDTQYVSLLQQLSSLGLAHIHVVDHSALGAPPVPESIKASLRKEFKGTFIMCGGFDAARAEDTLANKRADLVAFGRPFLANPDLVERMRTKSALNAPDMTTFYTPGPKGYTDYPSLKK